MYNLRSKTIHFICKASPEIHICAIRPSNTPDIAQTIVVSCYGLGIACDITGLHTLKIKETDRLVALQNELTKLGAIIQITDQVYTFKTQQSTGQML